jgi:beta-glucosidase
LIRGADVVLACMGFNDKSGAAPTYEGEGSDRTYALPAAQLELLEKTFALNPRTGVLLTTGGAVDVSGWLEKTPGLMMTWYPGSNGGTAIAEAVFGDISPSGKLPFTWEHRLEDYPAYGNYPTIETGRVNTYKEGVFIGYRRQHLQDKPPLFAFGQGLSYTTFTLGEPVLDPEYVGSKKDSITVNVAVTNTGSHAGSQVVQLYATPPRGELPRPEITLIAYAKIALNPGETKTVALPFSSTELQYWDAAKKGWGFTAGDYTLHVASSSVDLGKSVTLHLPLN